MSILLLILFLTSAPGDTGQEVYLPLNVPNRLSLHDLVLTGIGQYGLMRKARPTVPSHFHTGIDMKRPGRNYVNEPIYPVAKGIVISKRTDGPYGQLIVEHEIGGRMVWTVYEHVAGIAVNLGSAVDPMKPMARFFNKAELTKYGWQFDHVHLEVLKVKPIPLKPEARNPERHYTSYSLVCHTTEELQKYFVDPMEFFESSWSQRR